MSVGSTNFPGSLDTALDLVEVANKASTTVSGGTLSSGNTTVTVASTTSFTSSGIIGIDDELIAYTGKTATTFTGCTRAFESTTAASHADGAAVKQYITAASHNVQSAAIIAIETKVGSGSSTPAVNTVLTGSGTGTSAWGQVTNAMLAGSIQASKLVGTDIATVGTITSGTLSTGTVLGGVTVTLGSDATGDIYYRNSGGVLTRLGIGTTGQVLTVASGLPSWTSVTASAGGTNTQLQYNSSNSLAGISGATSNGTNVTFGSGNLIATSPSITTSLTTGSTSFDLINTTATTVNFAGAATTLNMAGGSGAVINLGGGANAAELRFLEPSGSGTNYTALKAQAQAANVTYTLPAADGTSGQVLSTNGSGTLSWATASGGGGGTPGGSTGDYQINGGSSTFAAGVLAESAGRLTATPTVSTTGSTRYLRVITPADTALTASTEAIGIQFGGNTSVATVTRQFSAGALTSQREYLFVPPTYSFTSTSTITTAATVAIGVSSGFTGSSGNPIAGTNANITNRIALYVDGLLNIGTTDTTDVILGSPMTYGLNVLIAPGTRFFAGQRSTSDSWVGITDGTIRHLWQNNPGAGGLFGTTTNHRYEFMTQGVTRLSIDNGTNGGTVGINKTSAHGAQLHVISGSASRVGLRVDSAASPTASIFQVTVNGTASTGFEIDGNTTSGNTRMLVYDVATATLARVSVGAADSGGTGFKVLRIPN